MTYAQKKQLEAARQRDRDLVRADASGKLTQKWLKVQEQMFTAGLPAEFYAAVQSELDYIAEQRDEAEAEERAALQRLTKAA